MYQKHLKQEQLYRSISTTIVLQKFNAFECAQNNPLRPLVERKINKIPTKVCIRSTKIIKYSEDQKFGLG